MLAPDVRDNGRMYAEPMREHLESSIGDVGLCGDRSRAASDVDQLVNDLLEGLAR
jgi:hypothetical protein